MKEIYKKVIQGNANDNLKMIIVIHGLFASELKACLIQEFPEKYKDGYDFLDSSNGPGLANPGNMQSSHHSKHPIFVRSVENNVIPDNTSNFVREALQDKDNTLNLVVTSKNREFLKTIRKKYKTVINKNTTWNYERSNNDQLTDNELKNIKSEGFLTKSNDKKANSNSADRDLAIYDELEKRLVGKLSGNGRTEVVHLDMYNLQNVDIKGIIDDAIYKAVNMTRWIEVRWQSFLV